MNHYTVFVSLSLPLEQKKTEKSLQVINPNDTHNDPRQILVRKRNYTFYKEKHLFCDLKVSFLLHNISHL